MSESEDRLYERLLVLRSMTGDEGSFAELVERFSPRLRYYLRKMLPRRDDQAEDLRLLTWGTVAVWVAALVLIFGDLVWFALLFPAHAKVLQDIDAGNVPAAQLEHIQRELVIAFHMGTLIIAFSVFITTLAAFLTVLLLFATRRATLRQVNANLAEICEQLKQMRGKSATVG